MDGITAISSMICSWIIFTEIKVERVYHNCLDAKCRVSFGVSSGLKSWASPLLVSLDDPS